MTHRSNSVTAASSGALATARSLLFVPANRPERFAKALGCGADASSSISKMRLRQRTRRRRARSCGTGSRKSARRIVRVLWCA